jgi:WD40 repeat protein
MKNITKLTIGLITAGLIGCGPGGLLDRQRENPITYNATNISEVRTLTGHSKPVVSVAIAPKGRTIVSGSIDGTIKIWDLASGRLKKTLTNGGPIIAVAIGPKGRTIVSSSDDSNLKVWDAASGNLKATLLGNSSSMFYPDTAISIAISPDGKTAVSGSLDGSVKIRDLETSSFKASLTGHGEKVRSVAISADGQTIVSASWDNTIKVWDLATGRLKITLDRFSSRFSYLSVAISPDGETVVGGSSNDTVKVWDATTGRLKATLKGHSDQVKSVAVSPDGQTIVSGSLDNTIKIWDLATGSLKATLTDSSPIFSVAIGPRGRTIVSSNVDGAIKVWQVSASTKRQPTELSTINDNVDEIKFKQSEAEQNISSIAKGQQANFVEFNNFSDNIRALGLAIEPETENYSYEIPVVNSSFVVFTATAKDKQLKSYSGIVHLIEIGGYTTTKGMICETDRASSTALFNFEDFEECPSGSSQVEY